MENFTAPKHATAIYSDIIEDECFNAQYDYTPIYESFGEVVHREDLGSYQGDTLLLLRRGDQYAYLCVGWGSCSGCDALQACGCAGDIDALIQDLWDECVWRSKANTLAWFCSHDWQGDYMGRVAAGFVAECIFNHLQP